MPLKQTRIVFPLSFFHRATTADASALGAIACTAAGVICAAVMSFLLAAAFALMQLQGSAP